MKKVLSVIFVFVIAAMFALNTSAAGSDLADIGKTVITFEDWSYEKVNSYGWEIDEYVGSDAEVELPWSFAKEYVTTIGDYAFNGNTTVSSLETTGVLESIGEYAFNGCSSLRKVTLFDKLTSLGLGSFYGCNSINDINLQDTSIGEIPAYCFAECGFDELALPETCTSIGNMAFYNCSSLSKLTVPASVTDISLSAFTGCNNVVIHCFSNSAAHIFARDNGIAYVLLDEEPGTYLLGDTDNNQNVDVVDATWIQRYVALMNIGVIEDTVMQGDVDGDGDISVVDATFILRYCVSIATPYDIGEFVELS